MSSSKALELPSIWYIARDRRGHPWACNLPKMMDNGWWPLIQDHLAQYTVLFHHPHCPETVPDLLQTCYIICLTWYTAVTDFTTPERRKIQFYYFSWSIEIEVCLCCWVAWSWLFLPRFQVVRQEHFYSRALVHGSELAENLIAFFTRLCMPIWNRFAARRQAISVLA